MNRKSFFESIIREIDLLQEYKKLESMVCEERLSPYHHTLNDAISMGFRNWTQRMNFTSFEELRNSIGFRVIIYDGHKLSFLRREIDENAFFNYCEMLINVMPGALKDNPKPYQQQALHVKETICADLALLNHRFVETKDGKMLLVQCDAAASSVADLVQLEVGQAIIQYNHFLLKEDIDKKRNLLRIIADELEPKHKLLKQLNKSVDANLFFLFNNMNIRHNNRDAGDKQHYNPVFDKLSNNEVEVWYDDIYQLALYALLLIDNDSRMKKVELLKQSMIDYGS